MSLHSASCCWRAVACGGRGAELLCDRRPGVDRELPPCHWVLPAHWLRCQDTDGRTKTPMDPRRQTSLSVFPALSNPTPVVDAPTSLRHLCRSKPQLSCHGTRRMVIAARAHHRRNAAWAACRRLRSCSGRAVCLCVPQECIIQVRQGTDRCAVFTRTVTYAQACALLGQTGKYEARRVTRISA